MKNFKYIWTPLLALVLVVITVFAFAANVNVRAQDGDPTPQATVQPTSEFDFVIPPTFAPPTGTLDPSQLPSLSGVGGQAANANVAIRSGAGLDYPRIGYLRHERWIDIVGWNGWEGAEEGRTCSPDFEGDLDMWVQVQFGDGRRGWIARCVLNIRGDVTKLPIVTASGERILQR